jgi:hypothetical protein
MALLYPSGIMTDGFITMTDSQLNMLEAIVRKTWLEVRFLLPGRGQLLIVTAVPGQGIVGLP